MSIKHFQCSPFVNNSERHAAEYIKARLQSHANDHDWVLLTNYSSSSSQQYLSDELDLIVVGPAGVSVVEIKHWNSASLKGRGQYSAEAEADKLNAKAKRLKGKLSKACDFDLGFVDGKFLFTKGENDKYASGTLRHRIRGIDVFGLAEWKELLDIHAQAFLTNSQIRHIGSVLEPHATAIANERLRSFDDTFFELEPIREVTAPFRRLFHAIRRPDRDRVVLHIYDLTAAPDPHAYEIAKREFDILRRLQKSQYIPNLMDSFQEAKRYPGEIYFFSYLDTGSPTLAKRAEDPNWAVDERAFTALQCLRALDEVHAETDEGAGPILHRNLTPESIHVLSNNEPMLTNLHLAKVPGAQTVATSAPHDFGELEGFFAPEVRAGGIGASSVASDIFSMCASLSSVFMDESGSPLSEVAEEVLRVLQLGINESPSDRHSPEEIYNGIISLFSNEMSIPADPNVPAENVPVDLWDESTIQTLNGRYYRIVTRLGAGGFGTTFKVMEVNPETLDDDSGPYVAKAITNESAGPDAAKAYARVRAQTGADHLAGVLEVTTTWKPDSITALLKWVKGQPLEDLKGVLEIYLEDVGLNPLEDTILTWLEDMCSALVNLHEAGLLHGDISPKNIIVDGGKVTLIDFDTAIRAGNDAIGYTPAYCSPEISSRMPTEFSDDLYALAATFFDAIFDRPPFQRGGVVSKSSGLCWDGLDQSNWVRVAQFLDRATRPSRSDRFASAMDAVNFLRSLIDPHTQTVVLNEEPISPIVRSDNRVGWLSDLLQSYPGSPKGNAETRGLDSDFARLTYVETSLDRIIVDDIKSRRVSLVVLCGNAGDGKTAFLQNLARNLGMEVETSSVRIWDKELSDGLRVYANLDGSASFQGRAANELLDECFAPFLDNEFPDDLVHLVAVNDGKLLEWLIDSPETPLTEALYEALSDDDTQNLDSRIRFIDLNKRSLVGGFKAGDSNISSEFVDLLLAKMINDEGDVWSACLTCTAQNRCHAWTSVEALRSEENGPNLRKRLTRALLAVHQRGEIHITARSLRAALVYIFFGTHECSDLHDDQSLFPPMYYDRAFDFDGEYRQGELLDELSRLDPALESHPEIDRFLLRSHLSSQRDGLHSSEGRGLSSLRREGYFVMSEQEIESVGRSSSALELAGAEFLSLFLKVGTASSQEVAAICNDLCDGIARLEDLPEEAFNLDPNVVPLKITPRTPTETAFWVPKPRERFSLRARSVAAVEGIETLHTHVILSYEFENGHSEELVIGAELFNLLMELRDGLQLADAHSDDIFANLSIFKQRLAQEGDRKLFAWNPANESVVKLEAKLVDGAQILSLSPAVEAVI